MLTFILRVRPYTGRRMGGRHLFRWMRKYKSLYRFSRRQNRWPTLIPILVILVTGVSIAILPVSALTADANTGSMTVFAEDETGASVSGARIILYDNDWNVIGSKTTDNEGKVSWSGLDPGSYHIELYFDDQFWAGDVVEVESGEHTRRTIERVEPYVVETALAEETEDGRFEVGEMVTISPNVRNDAKIPRDTRVTISIDRDNDGNAEASVVRGPLTIGSHESKWYGYDFSPEKAGTYQIRVQVEINVNDQWGFSADTGWSRTFTVDSPTGTPTDSPEPTPTPDQAAGGDAGEKMTEAAGGDTSTDAGEGEQETAAGGGGSGELNSGESSDAKRTILRWLATNVLHKAAVLSGAIIVAVAVYALWKPELKEAVTGERVEQEDEFRNP